MITVNYNGQDRINSTPLWQYDYGQKLKIENVTLPAAYEVHFSNTPDVDSVTMIGDENGVDIPDALLMTGQNVYAWLYLHNTETDGYTKVQIFIPVAKRSKPTNTTPTPVQQDVITQAIAALDAAVEQAGADATAAGQSADDAERYSGLAEDAKEAAEDAAEAAEQTAQQLANFSVDINTLPAGSQATVAYSEGVMTFGIPEGEQGPEGPEGPEGEQGPEGAPGEDGYSPTISVQNITGGHRITITDKNGSQTVDVMDGEQGQTGPTGNGIASITKTGTSGNVDTYTILYTNGQSTTFTVTNGNVSSVAGKTGAVTLDAGDVSYDGTQTYSVGTVGKGLNDLKGDLNILTPSATSSDVGKFLKAKTVSDGKVTEYEFGEGGGGSGDLDDKADIIISSASGSIASFSDGADDLPVKDLTIQIEPVQSGSGDPSPDNVRPITGWTGANVSRTGKNLFDISKVTGCSVSNLGEVSGTTLIAKRSGAYSGIYWLGMQIYIPKNATITISADVLVPSQEGLTSKNVAFGVCNIGHDVHAGTPVNAFDSKERIGVTLNVISGGYYYLIAQGQGNIMNERVEFSNIQVELSSTATDYEPYVGTTIPISWQTEVGTVYGGSLDVTTGVLTVDRTNVDLGTLTWELTNSEMGLFRTGSIPSKARLSSEYPIVTASSFDNMQDKAIRNHGSWVYVKDSDYIGNTATQFKTAMSGVQLVYELATPVTYQLTPQELKTLLGDNNIWSDTGDSAVQYHADTKLYVDGQLNTKMNMLMQMVTANHEDGTTASQAYAQGKYFIKNGQLCKAKTAIASGATFTLGTNYEVTDIGTELYSLNQ